MSDLVAVLMTAANAEEAETLARALVEEELAACVNVVGGIRSVYRWQGEVCSDAEVLLIAKSTRAAFARLEARVRELHSYDVPEVIALPIEEGSSPYLDWLRQQVG